MSLKMPIHFILSCLLLIYLGLALPIHFKNEELSLKLVSEKKTATQMIEMDQALQAREIKTASTERQRRAKLIHLQGQLDQEDIKPHLTQASLLNDSELHLSFASINFDQLMHWLDDFVARENLNVSEVAIKQLDTKGAVKAELHLTP